MLCLVKPVNARFLSLPNSVKYDSSFISFSAFWQVNSFFFQKILRFLILCSYSFYFSIFCYAVTVSKFSELFSYDAATVFFSGINSAKVFCGRMCLRTMMTRALCRRRTGETVLRAEQFGDLITVDYNVFNEEGESRNNDLHCRGTRSRH